MKIVFDSNVIIYYLIEEPKAVLVVNNIFAQQNDVYISTITEMEVLSYSSLTNAEIDKIQNFINFFNKIPVYSLIAWKAAELRRKYKIKPLDALIASTSIYLDAELFTFNLRDFKKIKELKLYKY